MEITAPRKPWGAPCDAVVVGGAALVVEVLAGAAAVELGPGVLGRGGTEVVVARAVVAVAAATVLADGADVVVDGSADTEVDALDEGAAAGGADDEHAAAKAITAIAAAAVETRITGRGVRVRGWPPRALRRSR
jgi:hypothetical protein